MNCPKSPDRPSSTRMSCAFIAQCNNKSRSPIYSSGHAANNPNHVYGTRRGVSTSIPALCGQGTVVSSENAGTVASQHTL
ncbi:MAG: hypothetical protein LBJ07_00220 [Actinomycetes bacterium]|nr:hypothetical protein [Actinomycetes bacterium]